MIDTERTQDVLLAWVHNGNVRAEFMDSVIEAIMDNAPRERPRLAGYYPGKGPYIHSNRSHVARYFLEKTDHQWLWMCDTDMSFEPDTLYRLLACAEEFGCPFLGAAYWNQYNPKLDPYLSWLVFMRGSGTETGLHPLPDLPPGRQPVQIAATGMGCTIIHRDVIQAVAGAYPNDPWDTFGADIILRFKDGRCLIARTPEDFDMEITDDMLEGDPDRLGEDVTFCLRARKEGFSCFGCPTVTAEHIKAHMIRPPKRDSGLWTPTDGQGHSQVRA